MTTQPNQAWNDYLMGKRLESGDNCEVDLALASQYFRRAAFRGLSEAQHALGFLYATGQGLPREEDIAIRWFTAAAEQGHTSAQHNLGVMYAEGRGVEPDEQAAVRWFYEAALGGSADARSWLERCEETDDIEIGQ